MVRRVALRQPDDEPDDERQEQREADHPPTGATGHSVDGLLEAPGQPGRTAPTYGMEYSGATRMPADGFSAFTIMPLPMYMPTWLIGL